MAEQSNWRQLPTRCGTISVACWLLLVAASAAETPAPKTAEADSSRQQSMAGEGWTATRTFPAAEAHQAAAADGQRFYAITNGSIAVYDRRTGERIGVSQGAAKHLNSGFLHKGKLYAAHSNFPGKPEQSQLRQLDLKTLELTTAHDFGDNGGSLTWAVFEDGAWWCNFARYGAENSGTFLVRYDSQWNETGRWTYPEKVISQLGQFSLSGGLWHDGHLLVTGHDDPHVFRLKLPAEGQVLEYVDQLPVPFTGQGIAVDPLTGGLVGINRAKRLVVFAEPVVLRPVRLRVLTYNIHHAEGVDGRLDLERIAGVIRESRADIVALQEVDQKVRRSEQVDQPAELARLTGLHVAFGSNITHEGGLYGNAVLSRYPVLKHRNHRLPNINRGEQRGVLEAELQISGASSPLLLLATHFDHRPASAERLASAKAINKLVEQRKNQPALLAGDLNAVPASGPLEELTGMWQSASSEEQPTVPVGRPTVQIDYVLLRPANRWQVISSQVLDEAVASDHRALLAVLELKPAGSPENAANGAPAEGSTQGSGKTDLAGEQE